MLSSRTILSLAQFLTLQDQEYIALLLNKHGLQGGSVHITTEVLRYLTESLEVGTEEQFLSLLDEIARTQGDLRVRVTPRYRCDERFDDLEKCLQLDGYVFRDRAVIPLDPSIMGVPPVEDDLTQELRASGLTSAEEVIRKLDQSAGAFRRPTPNYNACLNDARVVLQTLATSIAQTRSISHPGSFDPTRWGSIIAYLKSTSFVTDEEERGLVGVFGFVSPGSHRPLGLSDEESARLGRSFVAGMCWFLVKRFRAAP